ncbi:hypothetical protein D3C78_1952800 [compost metagenome]
MDISLVTSDLMVMALEASTVPCTSIFEVFCSTPTAMPAILATSGLSVTVADDVDVIVTSLLDTRRACVPTLMDDL